MFLNVQGATHPIRPGINVIGSVVNERYNTILLHDKCICTKHASLRFDLANNRLQVLDLCSSQGVTVDQRPIEALTWTEVNVRSQILFGTIRAAITERKNQNDDLPFDEDSTDAIDCSLEGNSDSNSGSLGDSRKKSSWLRTSVSVHNPPASPPVAIGENSFTVPATQQLDDSRLSSHVSKNGPVEDELADDEDHFFIPETQQQDDEDAGPSQPVLSITPQVPMENDKGPVRPVLPFVVPVEHETTQNSATVEEEYFQMTELQEDSNDALFNNEFVRNSEELLQHVDPAEGETRESILPERSVDSISFHDHRNATLEMSRIEWNESRQASDQPTFENALQQPDAASLAISKKVLAERDRSISPGLHVDDGQHPADERQSTVTPEIDFRTREEADEFAVTPEVNFDGPEENQDNDEEISLNQEGCLKTPVAACDVSNNPYEMETQAFPEASNAFSLRTQPLQLQGDRSDTVKTPPEGHLVRNDNAYEMPTQFLRSPTKSSRKSQDTARDCLDSETQPLVLVTPVIQISEPTDSGNAERVSRNVQIAIDEDDLLTQPMSPPKWNMESHDGYDLQTQPLKLPTIFPAKKMVPFVILKDIMHVRRVSNTNDDPSVMETQLLVQDEEGNAYDIPTQPLPGQTNWADAEVSHFNPNINSTVLQISQTKPNLQQQLEVSPSTSNKENSKGTSESFNSEDELCLAETIPIGKLYADKEKEKKEAPTFIVPAAKTEATATPKPSKNITRRRSELFEFLTPEHPMLNLPKADKIRSASDRMRTLTASRSHESNAAKPKYHFNDSSSSDDDFDRIAFKKTSVSVALETELAKVREDGQLKKRDNRANRKLKIEKIKQPPKRSATEQRSESPEKAVENQTHQGTSDAQDNNVVRKSKRCKGAAEKKEEIEEDSRKKKESRKKSTHSTKNVEDVYRKTYTNHGRRDDTYKKERESLSSSDRKKLSDDEQYRVSTRSHRTTQRKHPIDESVDYQSKSSKSVPISVPSVREGRKRRDHSPVDRREEQNGTKIVSTVPRTRESKRQKSGQSVLAVPEPEPVAKHRLRRTTTGAKKVEDTSFTVALGQGMASGLVVGFGNVSSTSSDGSTKSDRSSRPRLIFTRMSPEPYRKSIARAGGKVVDIPELATILVTDRIFRTHKFLCAVAKGIPIVGQSYLDALQISDGQGPIDPWDHILSHPETEKRYKFRLRDTLLNARKQKLFLGYTVFVTSSTQPPPSELYLVLSCAGAKALKHPTQQPKDASKVFVISDPADAASWPKYREHFPSISIVSTEGFMLSIMQHSINFEKHQLI